MKNNEPLKMRHLDTWRDDKVNNYCIVDKINNADAAYLGIEVQIGNDEIVHSDDSSVEKEIEFYDDKQAEDVGDEVSEEEV